MTEHAHLLRIAASLLLATSTLASSGCELLESLEGSDQLVHVFATHHATKTDGLFPHLGGEGQDRVFENDLGWTITLEDGYVVTSSIELVACDGSSVETPLSRGQLPENLEWADLEVWTVGSADAPSGDYCSVLVEYSSYEQFHERSADDYKAPDVDAAHGATVYLRGFADKGDERVLFEIATGDGTEVSIDISTIEDGRPYQVEKDQHFPGELTVSKAYDRFFDGVDFASFDADALEDELLDRLADETKVSIGTTIWN